MPPSFQPSEYSQYSGADLAGVTDWFPSLNPVTQYERVVDYFTGGGTTSTLSTGYYKGPNADGYYYKVDGTSGDITIAASTHGGAGTVMKKGTAANTAVRNELLTGGKLVSSAEVRAAQSGGSGGGGGSSYSPSAGSGAGAGSGVPDAGGGQDVPFYKATWFPYVVGGAIVVAGVAAILFWPSKKEERVPAHRQLTDREHDRARDHVPEHVEQRHTRAHVEDGAEDEVEDYTGAYA